MTSPETQLESAVSKTPSPVGSDAAAAADTAAPDWVAHLPPGKPWDQRKKSVDSLAGGVVEYLETLKWIATQCATQSVPRAELVDRYRLQYGISESNARFGLQGLRRGGILALTDGGYVPTPTTRRWLESGVAELVAGMLHANVQFIGEMIAALGRPLSTDALLEFGNERYSLAWTSRGQINVRAAWLRSAGLVAKTHDGLRATPSGVAFLEQVDIYEPPLTSSPTDGSQPPAHTPQARLPQGDSSTAPDAAAEIGDRLVSLSCDGARHKEFEAAVRDAFDFLGFEAEHLSGSGQTDVLLTATHAESLDGKSPPSNWRYRVTVDSKAATGGKLTSNQVNWPALEKHRKQHDARFSLLVGPGPGGQLLQFAADQAVGVLDASELSSLCEAHASVPLATSAYFTLFADSDGHPRGGLIDTSVVESAREAQVRRQQLLAQVFQAVEAIAPSFKPPDAGLVHFNLSQVNSGQKVSEAMSSKSLSRCKTVSPAFSAVAARRRSGTEGARCWPRSESSLRTSTALISTAGSMYWTGMAPKGG